MKTFKISKKSAGNNMKRYLLALLTMAIINSGLIAESQFQQKSVLREIFKKNEAYEGYLKHRMPLTLQLTGSIPQTFDWSNYKWEANFPQQDVQSPFGVPTPYSEIDERKARVSNSTNSLPGMSGLPGVMNNQAINGSENKITTGEKIATDIEKGIRSEQELLDEEDLVELFGKGLNRIANGSQSTSFEVPNSGFAPSPVLKNDANYSKE